MLALAVIVVVGNTIRLDIENRREEIVVMKLIGAPDGFIRRPFLYTGFWYGMLGGVIAMLLVLMVTSKGIAGVPRASLVVIAATLAQFNLPEAGLLLLLGIDHFLDMARSATNVIGNSVATAVVSKWEGQLRAEGEPVPEELAQAIAPVTSSDVRS